MREHFTIALDIMPARLSFKIASSCLQLQQHSTSNRRVLGPQRDALPSRAAVDPLGPIGWVDWTRLAVSMDVQSTYTKVTN